VLRLINGIYFQGAVAVTALSDRLASYAAYHRDPRNIFTHMFGIPMIVLAAAILLSRPAVSAGPVALSPGLAVGVALAVYYLSLDLGLGLAMTVFLAVCLGIGQALAATTGPLWLGAGVGLFILGWVIQFIGHKFEGRKPAFLDDVMGLAIGPLFIGAELGFMVGWRGALKADVEAKASTLRDNASV